MSISKKFLLGKTTVLSSEGISEGIIVFKDLRIFAVPLSQVSLVIEVLNFDYYNDRLLNLTVSKSMHHQKNFGGLYRFVIKVGMRNCPSGFNINFK